jgi:hypothetical protein
LDKKLLNLKKTRRVFSDFVERHKNKREEDKIGEVFTKKIRVKLRPVGWICL